MKIIIAAMPFTGHLNPMLGVARHLADRGHEIVVLTGASQRARVEAAGLVLRALPAAIDYADMDAHFPQRARLEPGLAQVSFDFEHIFVGPMTQQAEALMALSDSWGADLILAEHLFLGTLPLLMGLHPTRPAIIHCGVCPLLLAREDGAPIGPGLPYTDDPAVRAHYRDVVTPMVEAVAAPAQASLEAQLAALGVGGRLVPMMEGPTRLADLHLQFGVPGLDLPREAMPGHIRFIGLPPTTPTDAPLPSWTADVDDYGSVVLVTQGTVANENFDRLIRPTIEVLADRPDTLVVVTGGGKSLEGLGPLPANVRAASYFPLDWLLPKLSALVTNGGFGTVLQALAHGVPVVVAGTTEDKAEVACRVAHSGAGIDLRTDTPEPQALAAAIDAVLADPAYRTAARRLQMEFVAYDSRLMIDVAVADATNKTASPAARLMRA
ncbi:glycosyltransferase [Caulobacter segnis]|uniref:glycosyltransferase n=1 Tax=Caulobacter segnis TaxID=88688 RepID=UPI00240EDEBD|nr:glycosyltransferase [Caulobacter segnis]MDG2520462.1 glycosyltransferase [Caulobacter segnis]